MAVRAPASSVVDNQVTIVDSARDFEDAPHASAGLRRRSVAGSCTSAWSVWQVHLLGG